jgi:inner membrane protein
VLLIGLSLSLLWLMVVRSKARAHVMHYTLIALNLAIFFLQLLSLAEKVDFLIAYAVSATAVTALNVVYLSGLLGSLRKAVLAAVPSAVSFGALYSLLISEDQALLLGSLFVFAVLAGLMLFTRKLDWHGVLAARGA